MNYSKEEAFRFWKLKYGDKKAIEDFRGQWCYLDDFGKKNFLREGKSGTMNDYGWTIVSGASELTAGEPNLENIHIVHWKTEKSMNTQASSTTVKKAEEGAPTKNQPSNVVSLDGDVPTSQRIWDWANIMFVLYIILTLGIGTPFAFMIKRWWQGTAIIVKDAEMRISRNSFEKK